MSRHLSSRLKSLNYEKTLHYIKHDFRIDYSNHIKNKNINYFYLPSKNKKVISRYRYTKLRKQKRLTEFNHIKNKVDNLIKKHHKLYEEKYNRKIQTEKTNSINRGVLTFPRDLENDFKNEKFNKEEFIKMGIETIELICKELKIELVYITIHLDETTPHFHYVTSNFDEKGVVIQRNKEVGRKIQDLSDTYFKKFGIVRGISKDITGNRNIENENEKLKNQLKQLEEKNQKLEEENQKLKNQNEELIKNILINETEYNKLLTDVKTLKEEYIKFNEEVETKKEFYKSVLNPILTNLKEIEKDYKFFNSKTLISTLSDEQLKERINRINNTFKIVKENIESPKFQTVKKQLEDYSGFSM